MQESVILSSPLMLVLYGVALGLCIFDLIKKTGIVLPVLSALIAVGTSAYALLCGASFYETAAAVSVFLLVNLLRLRRSDE